MRVGGVAREGAVWGRAAGLTKAGVLGEVSEELLTLLLQVPTPPTAAPGGYNDASGAGVHIVGRHVKPWTGIKGSKGGER